MVCARIVCKLVQLCHLVGVYFVDKLLPHVVDDLWDNHEL